MLERRLSHYPTFHLYSDMLLPLAFGPFGLGERTRELFILSQIVTCPLFYRGKNCLGLKRICIYFLMIWPDKQGLLCGKKKHWGGGSKRIESYDSQNVSRIHKSTAAKALFKPLIFSFSFQKFNVPQTRMRQIRSRAKDWDSLRSCRWSLSFRFQFSA